MLGPVSVAKSSGAGVGGRPSKWSGFNPAAGGFHEGVLPHFRSEMANANFGSGLRPPRAQEFRGGNRADR